MTNSDNHANAVYAVRVTQDHYPNLTVPQGVDNFSLYGVYTAGQFAAAFPEADLRECLIAYAPGDNNGADSEVNIAALSCPGSIIDFLSEYAEDPGVGYYRQFNVAELDLYTLADLLAAQAHFREQLKSPETLPPEIVQLILDYVQKPASAPANRQATT